MYGMMPYMQMYSRMPLPSDTMVEEQPTYVNAKQYRRIIKRRQARALLEKKRAVPSGRKNYLHESRHAHACRRPRGPGGRFLTKDELATFRKLAEEGVEEKAAVAQAVAEAEAIKAANGGAAPPLEGTQKVVAEPPAEDSHKKARTV